MTCMYRSGSFQRRRSSFLGLSDRNSVRLIDADAGRSPANAFTGTTFVIVVAVLFLYLRAEKFEKPYISAFMIDRVLNMTRGFYLC